MPIQRRHRPVRVEISPLLDRQISSSGSSPKEEYAQATPALWQVLCSRLNSRSQTNGHLPECLGIAIEWPEDRRIPTKGKRKTTVVWVKPGVRGCDENTLELFVPPRLLPPFSATPLSALIYRHDPIELSLVILQPVIASALSSSTHLDLNDLDIASLYDDRSNGGANGLPNGHHYPAPALILRQDETINIPRTNGSSSTVRVLSLDPVQQGVLTPQTRVIIASEPYVSAPNTQWTDMDGIASESSHGQTHLSLAAFDPDAFLSTSLDLRFAHGPSTDGSPLPESIDLDPSSHSSTSGSITPRPNGTAYTTPSSPPAQIEELMVEETDEDSGGTRFSVIIAAGPSAAVSTSRWPRDEDDVCWLGVGGLGRAGIFEGDWVHVRTADTKHGSSSGRLLRALAWERLDEEDPEIPSCPIVISPATYRHLSTPDYAPTELIVCPTSFGAREPTLPIARTITVARIATAEGVDKRYERAWIKGLQEAFTLRTQTSKDGGREMRMAKRGDIISCPVWRGKPVSADEPAKDLSESESDSDNETYAWSNRTSRQKATALAYFVVTALSYDPLNALEDDFRSSISSKARAGELGCWVDVGSDGSTRMVLTGVEKSRVSRRRSEKIMRQIPTAPPSYNAAATAKLRNLLSSCFANSALASALQLSILIKGGRGAGKMSLIEYVADEVGFSIVVVDAFDIVGDTPAHTEGSILAAVEKTKACSPSLLVIRRIEALSRKAESGSSGRPPVIVKVLEDAMVSLREASAESGWPSLLLGTTGDFEAVPGEVLACFKQEIDIGAPNEQERLIIAQNALGDSILDTDVALSTISAQSAALQANDIVSLIYRAQDLSLERGLRMTQRSALDLRSAGLPLSRKDIDTALSDARSSYSDSIGAPKIPNVRWEDVGGLANVQKEILETVQLPLERPDLFAEGLKKRSGILLYGPPGTGKTLLAKAVATSCGLNFFSVKGPELLNMYIGESEANVRRVFQRARDASPCIIFMDELDSVAPKRGNQGDSGGVMDRIVSQLLAELDGMSSGGGQVFVMGATNRPDLLDPALLRPGRFDRMLYLSVATTNEAQASILKALTRKFKLEDDLDLSDIAESCPFNYTGADFYALCSDAMLRAMTRKAEDVDKKIEALNQGEGPYDFPHPLTPQYYLASMATPEEIEVKVSKDDFLGALEKLVPSVSKDEMAHYERVQGEFKGYEIGQKS